MAVATVNMAISLIDKGPEGHRATPSIKFTPKLSLRHSTSVGPAMAGANPEPSFSVNGA
jgi:hypothetical protein